MPSSLLEKHSWLVTFQPPLIILPFTQLSFNRSAFSGKARETWPKSLALNQTTRLQAPALIFMCHLKTQQKVLEGTFIKGLLTIVRS